MPVRIYLPALLALAALLTTGCPSSTPPGNDQPQEEAAHDHEHHHHADLGPGGGHLLALGDSGYQAEWIHDDESEDITVHLLDGDNQPAPVAYSVSFETKVEDETNTYDLEPVEPDNDGLASQFTINNGTLLTAVGMAEQSADAAQATLIANLQNGEFRAKIEVHDHDH